MKTKRRPTFILLGILAILVAAAVFYPSFLEAPESGGGNAPAAGQVSASSIAAAPPIAAPLAPMPQLDLKAAAAVNLAGNFYFLRFNVHHRWPMASLTKLLTAVVALENLNRGMGEPRKVKRLIYQMMVVSSNEAARELAEIGGGEQRFIEKMKRKAAALGMNQTSIFEPTGLSFLNQSTASDLEKLVNYIAAEHPFILQASRRVEIMVQGKKRQNINRFAGRPDFLGGKTGYTDEASGNLISIFQRHSQPILIIVLGAADYDERFKQTELILQWISKFYN